MSIPIPSEVAAIVGTNAQKVKNASLLLDKYCEHKKWPPTDNRRQDDEAPLRSLRRVASVLASGNQDLTAIRQLRREATDTLALQFLKTGHATEVIATTAARLTIGLSDGMIRNGGITLDRLTGLPTLRASAIKGVARNAALWQIRNEASDAGKQRLITLFLKTFGYLGTDVASGLALESQFGCPIPHGFSGDSAGMVTFLPAFPLEKVHLEIDLTNVHTPDYYTARGNAGDTALLKLEKPRPNYFPAVSAGASFSFLLSLTSRGKAALEATEILAYARASLVTALSHHGIGAKTASGYGWFHIDEDAVANRAASRKNAVAEMSAGLERAALEPDPALYATFAEMNEQSLRALVKPFAYDKRAWKTTPPECEETYRISVLSYLTEEKPDIYLAEKANPKSKFLKGLAGLAAHFSRELP